MEQFSYHELHAKKTSLEFLLEFGGLPLVVAHPRQARQILSAYINTYLREEIIQEGIVRRLEPFTRFLSVAGQYNAQILNLESLSREAKIPRSTAETYFEILEDTLIGFRLPSYSIGLREREAESPKFYFFDPGVARGASGLLTEPLDSVVRGSAFETWVYHELRVFLSLHALEYRIFHYRTHDGLEIDFVIEIKSKQLDRSPEVVLIEVKASDGYDSRWAKSMDLFNEGRQRKVTVGGKHLVYLGEKSFTTSSGVHVRPFADFVDALYAHEIVSKPL